MTQNIDVKKTLTKAILSEVSTTKGRKSTGTKIASMDRDIPIIAIEPFSK